MANPRKSTSAKSVTKSRISASLADQAALGQALLQSTSAGIYIVQGAKFVYLSPFFETLTGYSIKELLGQESLKLVHPDDREMVRKAATSMLKQRGRQNPFEYRFLKKNGDVMWVMETVSSIDYKGMRATLGSFMDIHQRKMLEETVAKSDQLHSAMLSQMYDACFEVDLAGNFKFANNSMCVALRYKLNELDGKHSNVIIPEEDRQIVLNTFNQVYKSGQTNTGFTHKVKRKDGIVLSVETSVSPVREPDGRITGFICVGRDVTESKRLHVALLQSEALHRSILEQMYDSYYEVDLAGNFTFVNDSVCTNLLYCKEELLGKNFGFAVPPDEVKNMFLAFNRVFRTGLPNKAFSHKILRRDGKILYAESSIDLRRNENGEPIGFRSISRDISERKQLEEALLAEKNFSDSVLDSMPGIFYALDENGKIIRWNKNEEKVTGYSSAELYNMDAIKTIAEEERENVASKIADVFSQGYAAVETQIMAKDGKKTRYLLTGARVDIGNKPYLIGMGIDISERIQAEQALKQSEERYRALFDSSLELVYVLDFEGTFLDANPATLELIGYNKEEIGKLNVASLFNEEDLPGVLEMLNKAGLPGLYKEMMEFKLRRNDGSHVYIEA
ncbi:MAG: PAS domain S-box protein, partial [Dehalococcoidia bacterium]